MFGWKSQRDAHVRGVHLLEFKCSECAHCATASQHLRTHVDAVHRKLKPFECIEIQCQKKFAYVGDRNRHEYTVHWFERRFACERCGKRFKQSGHLRAHVDAVHLGLRPFKCGVCEFAFSENGSRTHHFRTVHCHERRFPCALCESAFATRTEVRRHYRTQKHRAALAELDSVSTRAYDDRWAFVDIC